MARLIHDKGKDGEPERRQVDLEVTTPPGVHWLVCWFTTPDGKLNLACNPEMCAALDHEDIDTLLSKMRKAMSNYVRQVG